MLNAVPDENSAVLVSLRKKQFLENLLRYDIDLHPLEMDMNFFTLYYVTLYYVTLYYVTLYYVTLYYVFLLIK